MCMTLQWLKLRSTSPSSRRAWIEIIRGLCCPWPRKVALLAEGVDRNIDINREFTAAARSPSSRRAWIEIQCHPYRRHSTPVALLAEGVDRNTEALKDKLDGIGRPPRGGRG